MENNIKLYLPTKVVYFFSILFNKKLGEKLEILFLLKNQFPELSLSSELFMPRFNPLLTYYSKQMGGNESDLERFFCYSQLLHERDLMISIKLTSMKLEKDKQDSIRVLNIDPGYMAKEQLILSTHKPFAHRLYIGQGIYGEIEYLYQDNKWVCLPWTYPDYNDEEKKDYFLSIRKEIL